MFCSAFAGSLPYDVAAVLMLSLSRGKVLMLILGLVQDGYLISSKHCITIMSSCMLHFALHEWIPASWNPFVAPHTKKTKVLQIRQHNNDSRHSTFASGSRKPNASRTGAKSRGSQNATGQPCRKVFPGQPWETREPAAKEPAATVMNECCLLLTPSKHIHNACKQTLQAGTSVPTKNHA